MQDGANLPPQPEHSSPLLGFGKALLIVVFALLFLLLGLSMVHHRFFQGERVHDNGSIGQ